MISFENYFDWLNNEIFKKNCSRDKEIVFNFMLRKTKYAKNYFNNIQEEDKDNYQYITKILLKNIKKDIDIFANLVLIEKIEYLESKVNDSDNDDTNEILNLLKECYTYLSI